MPGEAPATLAQLRGRKHAGNSLTVWRESQTQKQAAVTGGRKGSGSQGLPIGKSMHGAWGTCVSGSPREGPGGGWGARSKSPRTVIILEEWRSREGLRGM